MRCGKLCTGCVGRKCHDPPDERSPFALGFCPACGGEGDGPDDCPMCCGRGDVQITHCPKKDILPQIYELLEFADEARDHHWPVGGGILEQVDGFRKACHYLWGLEHRIDETKRKQK